MISATEHPTGELLNGVMTKYNATTTMRAGATMKTLKKTQHYIHGLQQPRKSTK